MAELPRGTVTFFFSDIEGSTRLLESLGNAYPDLLRRHRELVRETFSASDGVELGTEGDSFFAVFPSAEAAIAAAANILRALAAEAWPENAIVKTRIGLHTGEASIAGHDYVGLDVHRAARIMAAAHGGQVLISDATRSLVERRLPDGLQLRDLGEHRLRDLSSLEHLFQVVIDGLPADHPALRSLNAIPNNLPVQATPLVGRTAELASIREHLESPHLRLVTLTGPGGIGKTRLALQAAADAVDRFPDGAYFADLAPARDVAAALDAVVRAVGISVSGQDNVLAEIGEHLRGRRTLLLLDNFEQVMVAAGEVATLASECAELAVLVTSREALRVRGEQLFPVAPLSLPDVRRHAVSADEAARYDAVRLFVQRAQQVDPGFGLADQNAGVVAEICAQLDGLPLAIELAAARLRLFSPEDLNARLRTRLEVLRGGARDLPERQRTLRSTIEWSYELLDADERAVFQMLSLFPTARIEEVEEVSRRTEQLADIDVVDRLTSLVDKSLVRSIRDEKGQRLSMLETIREYATSQLENGHLAQVARQAHAEFFVEFAEARHSASRGADRRTAIDDLAAELGNLLAAWRYYIERDDMTHLRTMLDALWIVHDARGWYHGAVALANDLLGLLDRSLPAAERAEDEVALRLTLARGLLAIRGYTGEVEDLYRDALAVAEASGALPKQVPVLRNLASFYLARGDLDRTIEIGNEILEFAAREGDIGLQVEGDVLLGPSLAFIGQAKEGLRHLDRAIAQFDEQRHGRAKLRLGPNPGVAAHAVTALFRWSFGYPDTADRHAQQALELAARLAHPYSLTYATFHVALLDYWRDRVDRAHSRAGDVLELAEQHDYPIWRALGLVLQGVTAARLGRHEEGLALSERGIQLYENLRTPPVFWPLLLAMRSDAFAAASRADTALKLMDEAIALGGEDNWEIAALRLQKGRLLMAIGDDASAGNTLRQALDETTRVGISTHALRAATALVQLQGAAAQRESVDRLEATLDAFTEGFDTPDLRLARSTLDQAKADLATRAASA